MERHWMMLSFTANRHNFTFAGLAVNSEEAEIRSCCQWAEVSTEPGDGTCRAAVKPEHLRSLGETVCVQTEMFTTLLCTIIKLENAHVLKISAGHMVHVCNSSTGRQGERRLRSGLQKETKWYIHVRLSL